MPSVDQVATNQSKNASDGVNHTLQHSQEHRCRAGRLNWLSELLDLVGVRGGTLDLVKEVTVIEGPVVIIIVPPTIIVRLGEVILSDRTAILYMTFNNITQ